MKLVPDIRNWHRWWSVRFGALSGACTAAATAYAAMRTIAPRLVEGVPQVILTSLTVGAMGFGAAGFMARFIDQPNLPVAPPSPPASNDFHQGAE
jgi:hypothetical protein